MAPYVTDITIDQVIDATIAFLRPFIPAPTEIIRGQVNRVPPPLTQYVMLTEIRNAPLSTPIVIDNDDLLQAEITGPKQIDIQIDFYGPDSGDYCSTVETVFRTGFAAAAFPSNIKPLYCSDAMQAPLTTAEKQYENRWTLTGFFQYNPRVIIPQESANVLAINILEDIQ